jgi:simple sugar transport system permease protein
MWRIRQKATAMRIELVKRSQHSRFYQIVSPFIALLLTLVAGAVIFAALGKNPATGLYYYFVDPLTQIWSLHELTVKAGPLILIAVGLCVCYRSNNWNIGAEGQFIVGAILASSVPILMPGFQSFLTLPLMLLLGMVGGALYAGIPALLKARYNANEILTSLMLVYVAQLFLDWLVRGPWRDPKGFAFPGSIRFPPAASLPEIIPSQGAAHYGFVIALVAAVLVWFFLTRTLKGFEVQVLGLSPRAGRFAGFSASGMVFFSFMLSGALAGLAGISEVSGAIGQLREVISPGYGFTAIIVAFLGRLNPLGAILAGLLLALTYLGGEAAQQSMGLSLRAVRVFQGMLLFFVLACDTLILYKVRFVGTSRAGAL